MDYTQKKKELEDKFNELEKMKQELIGRINEINSEQLRIQGEFRLADGLEKESKPEAKPEEAPKE